MKEYERIIKRDVAHRAQLFRARCNKGCPLGHWSECFNLAANFKEFHEKNYPGHHVFIDVDHIQCEFERNNCIFEPEVNIHQEFL